MNQIFKLQSTIGVDLDPYEKDLKTAEAKTRKTATAIQNAFDRIKGAKASVNVTGGGLFGSKGATDLLAKGGLVIDTLKGVFNVLTSVQQAGLTHHRTLQNAAIGFEILGGSAAGALRHIQDLQDKALKAPFELTDLVRASGTLQAFGFSAQEVEKDIIAIGDAASVASTFNGDFAGSLQGVILALGQMRSAGRLSLEEINQLTERGIPALDILSRKTGKSIQQIRKDIESGRVSGKGASELLIRGFREAYGGLSERLSQTTSGKESNLSDAYSKFAYESIKNGTVKGYDKAIDELTTQLGSTDALKFAQKTDFLTATGLQGVLEILKGGGSYDSVMNAGATIGKNIYEGMIKSEVKGLGDWIGKEFQEGVDLAKSVWETRSPSKVAEQLGMDVAEGYAIGLNKGTDLHVGKAMQRLLTGGLARKDEAESLSRDPRIRAMLDTLAKSEGANYNTLFGGGTFSDFSDHPNQRITRKFGGKGKAITSTAAGRYQFLNKTWESVAAQLGLTDFSPHSQDLAAIELMRQRGMIPKILNGDIAGALTAGNREWASLPGSPYGQPTHAAQKLIDVYNKAIGNPTTAPKLEMAAEKLERAAHAQLTMAERFALYNPGAMSGGAFVPSSPLAQTQTLGQVFGGSASINVIDQLEKVPLAIDMLGDAAQINYKKLIPLPPALEQAASGTESLSNALDKIKKEADALRLYMQNERWKDFGKKAGETFDDAINTLIRRQGTLKEVARSVAADLATGFFRELEGQILMKLTGKSSLGEILGDAIGGGLDRIFGGKKKSTDATKDAAKPVTDAISGQTEKLSTVLNEQVRQSQQALGQLQEMANCACQVASQPSTESLGRSILKGAISGAISGLAGGLTGGFGGGSASSGSGKITAIYDELGNRLPYRANGGSVMGGRRYVVGERGPEIFSPATSGSIIPNHKLEGENGDNLSHELQQASLEQLSKIREASEKSLKELMRANELNFFVQEADAKSEFFGSVTGLLSGVLGGAIGEGSGFDGGSGFGGIAGVGNLILNYKKFKGIRDIKARARGGRFSAFDAMVVGEEGPEIIIPERGGNVIPNPDVNRALESGSNVTNIFNFTINSTDGTFSRKSQQQVTDAVARALERGRLRGR